MGWIFKDEPATPPDPKTERTRVLLLALPFAILGLVALVMFVHDLFGGIPKQRAITILSFIAACIGFVALIFACVNIFGGFLVTQRMLGMYKKKAK